MFSWLIAHSPLLYLTQSLWRDEVYSIFMAGKPVAFFIAHLSFEPPLYYLLLHFWMKVFGMSEIAGRALSLVAFAGATVIVIFWAEKLFHKHWLSWWLPVFFFFNPMLIYYGMELRTYGWYMFFATLSLFAYSQKKWILWTAATVLGFYAHSFLVIVPLAQIVHYAVSNRNRLRFDSFIRSFTLFVLCIAPWVIKIALQAYQLKSSWYFPVDANLVTSVLGNLFLGYEGTPWYLWGFTKIISLFILLASCIALGSKKTRGSAGIFIYQIYIPLFIVIGISFIKPFYVNRYMTAVTIAEVFTVALAISAVKNESLRKIIAGLLLVFVLAFNGWYPNKHAKIDIRSTLEQVKMLKTSTDVIIAENPLIVFETMYYAGAGSRVYLYNPYHIAFPFWVGGDLVSESQMANDYPTYPKRAFLIHQNGTFDVVYKRPYEKH
jgi:hypothetical protein